MIYTVTAIPLIAVVTVAKSESVMRVPRLEQAKSSRDDAQASTSRS